ncbi:MAG: M48 family metallopeptidase, partial [Gemmatimonadales bacterium]|nr:M48 family metallopeptidase [Gemmatimonadales bacterium]
MHAQRSRRTLVVGLLAALAAPGCARNAATGANQFSLISEAQEIQMGRDNDQQVAASLGLYPDAALQEYVQQLGARIAATTERPGLPWTFRIVDDAAVNAFALPGGFVYVTRGLLAHVRSEAQLASVVGHEIGHVTARHSVTQLSRQQLAQFGLAVGGAVSPTFARYGALAGTGLSILFLKYSRADEQQADELGLRYMVRGGWAPNEMPEVFTMLERVGESAGGGRLPDWLATHPSPANRRDHITQGIAALPPGFGTTVNRNPYLRRLDNLVFGADPREGYFRGALFLHPASRFRFTFPEGWTTANEKQSVSAVSPQEDAVVQLTLAQEPSAAAAASSFFAQQGTTGAPPTRGSVGGLPAVLGSFTAATEGGTLSGDVVFVEYGGGVFRLLAYSGEARWSAY